MERPKSSFVPTQKVEIGQTGVFVTRLGLGTGLLDFENPDEAATIGKVKTALKLGVNYFDTAPKYALGQAETLLGVERMIEVRDHHPKERRFGSATCIAETLSRV
ncbi:aldo/keto reductase [Candidatus Curtissbacteria bacterium]|nr:aldo/keto reductase [Candidatus Curtissbacteria bacterium]